MESLQSLSCVSCGATELDKVWGITSTFFSNRALRAKPRVVGQLVCRFCRTRRFEIELTDAHLQDLYQDYRGDSYFQERHAYEPWYSRAVNDRLSDDTHLQLRRQQLGQLMADAGLPKRFGNVLDHGGDQGQMLADMKADQKAVYDKSGVVKVPGIISVTEEQMATVPWDVILSCHVLEHVIDPKHYIHGLAELGQAKTIYIFEIPYEPMEYFSFNLSRYQYRWLNWLCKKPKYIKYFDFLSTAFRVKFGTILPFLFPVLREHLTFFSPDGIIHLLDNCGFEIILSRIMVTGHIGIVARRLAS